MASVMVKNSRSKKITILGIVLICMFLAYWGYSVLDIGGYKGGIALTEQLNTIIHTGNTQKIKDISSDDKTYNFLVSVSKNARVERASDFQGGTISDGCYAALLENHKISAWMHKEKSIFGPRYTISKIKVW